MKLRPELFARQLLDKPLRSAVPGEIREGAAEAEKSPREPPVRDLVFSLGLPRDGLSAFLLSLAKFFSLPLDTKLILLLRQQALALAPGPAKTPEGGSEDPALPEPLRFAALAAAAAASKGVTLRPEALARYAAALAVSGQDILEDEAEPGEDREDPPGEAPRFSEPRKRGDFAERIEGRLPLLGVLNKIPGRDGRRWITLPFSCEQDGVVCRVSLRILVADTNGVPWKAERMALDIKTGQRRWSFMLENAGERSFARAVFGVRPPLKARAERDLRKLLGGLAEKLVPRELSGGAFPEEAAGAERWGT
jgi:hypothetical protein